MKEAKPLLDYVPQGICKVQPGLGERHHFIVCKHMLIYPCTHFLRGRQDERERGGL